MDGRGIIREALAATAVVAVMGTLVASVAVLTAVFGAASSFKRGTPRTRP